VWHDEKQSEDEINIFYHLKTLQLFSLKDPDHTDLVLFSLLNNLPNRTREYLDIVLAKGLKEDFRIVKNVAGVKKSSLTFVVLWFHKL